MHFEFTAQITETTFENEDGTKKTRYKQQGFLFLEGERFPRPFSANIDSREAAYEEGVEYLPTLATFPNDKYGGLDVSGFDLALVRRDANAPKVAKAS